MIVFGYWLLFFCICCVNKWLIIVFVDLIVVVVGIDWGLRVCIFLLVGKILGFWMGLLLGFGKIYFFLKVCNREFNLLLV